MELTHGGVTQPTEEQKECRIIISSASLLTDCASKMAQVWLATVPNNKDLPEKTFAAVQNVVTASSYCKISRVEIPNLVVGTLDSLMSLADDLTKIGMTVEVSNIIFFFMNVM